MFIGGRNDIQGDSVMLGQVSGVSYSHQSERLYKHVSGSKFNWKSTFNIP